MSAARAAVSAADPNIPVLTVETQMSTIEQRFAQEKVLAQAYTLFGGIALFVAAIGLFGLMSYNVSRRTREIGIRMALGAERREVLGLVLRESMLLVAIGVAIGIAASLGAGRLVRVAAIRAGADGSPDNGGGDVRDAGGIGSGGLSAGATGGARRPDDCAQVRIKELEDWQIGGPEDCGRLRRTL